jgi:hypothetical protein
LLVYCKTLIFFTGGCGECCCAVEIRSIEIEGS